MSGQEIDRRALWDRLDGVLAYESPLAEAADLAAVLQLAAEAGEASSVVGGEKGLARLAGRTAELLRATKADLDALRAEFSGNGNVPNPDPRSAA